MTPSFRSILSRILWLHVVALGAAAIAVPLAAFWLLNSTANGFENRTLRAHAASIASHLRIDQTGRWNLDLPSDLRTFYARGFNGFAYSVIDEEGRTIFTSLPREGAILAGRSDSASPIYFQRTIGNAIYYGARIPVDIRGHRISIEVAQNLENPDVIIDDIVADFFNRIGLFTIPIMLLVIVADVMVVRRALRPVLRASEQARSIEPGNMTFRLPTQDLPAEVKPLVEGFNQALDRLESGFRMQREFVADAAHELRTPLAVLRARIDALDNPEGFKILRRDIEVMARIVEQLLEVAELDAAVVKLDDVLDLRTICGHVADHMAPMARSAGRQILLGRSQNPVLVRGSEDLIFRAVRNLVENGLKHAPPGSAVSLGVEDSGVVCVSDEGPGVSAAERAQIFRRFWRRDRSRTDGAGLGLSIVASIMRAHGGSVDVADRPGGGAAFSLRFPLFAVEDGGGPAVQPGPAAGARLDPAGDSRPLAVTPAS